MAYYNVILGDIIEIYCLWLLIYGSLVQLWLISLTKIEREIQYQL